ncbi:hypothetical protein SNE40_014292 [Patella caerulea]|uniref:Reverse transcriptase n=1 Tax=Patella caerulea TaxID=87958 RepID=A0AAN8PCL6_PATCE
MNKDEDICPDNTKLMADKLQSLGYLVNYKKSVFQPAQKIVFFGFIIDTVTFKVYLTDKKISKLSNFASKLLKKHPITARQLASFIGLIVNAFYAILEAPLHYRALE